MVSVATTHQHTHNKTLGANKHTRVSLTSLKNTATHGSHPFSCPSLTAATTPKILAIFRMKINMKFV
jgi:hypothetical protein